MKNFIFEKNSLINGALALLIISFIAFGCACDDLDEAASEDSEIDTANEVLAEDVVPSDAKAKEMVETMVLGFADAFESGDFSTIHSKLAKLFQKQMTPDAIKKSSKPLLKKIKEVKLNIRSVETLKPEFMVKPFINNRKFQRPTLFLIGHYATEPLEIDFDFTYIFEDNDWKLVKFNILENDMSAMNANPDKDVLEVPSSEELQNLVETDLRIMKVAIDRKDFSSLHNHVSKKWNEQSTPATFEKMFAFSGKLISLGVDDIPGKSPQYTIEPHINIRNFDDPSLVVNGYYKTSPNQISFEFRYISEAGKWKIVGFTLSPATPTEILE